MLRYVVEIVVCSVLLIGSFPTVAAVRTWDDGGIGNDWSDRFNWSNNTVPDTADIAVLGDLPSSKDDVVLLGSIQDTVRRLTMLGGADLDTNGGSLVVTAQTVIGVAGDNNLTSTELIVRPSSLAGQPNSFQSGNIELLDGGRLRMLGGQVSITGFDSTDGTLFSNTSIHGYGTINFADETLSAPNATVFRNGGLFVIGVLEEQNTAVEPPIRKLTLNKPAALSWAQFELGGSVQILRNATLEINQGPEAATGFVIASPNIRLAANSRYDRDFVTHLGSVTVNSGATATLPAAPAVISGGTIAQNCSNHNCGLTVQTSDSVLLFEAQYNGFTGTLVNQGTIRFAGNVLLGPGISIQPMGTLMNENSSTMTLYDETDVNTSLQNDGVLELGFSGGPNFSLGEVLVRNFTQQSAGQLNIDLGGIPNGDYDVMTVQGNAILDGKLNVELIHGFVPIPGNTFTILETTAGNVAGEFDFVQVPNFNGMTFDVVYGSKSVALQVVTADPGDFNHDGAADGADFLDWQRGLSSDPLSSTDLALWETNYGTAFPLAAATTVPEPNSILLCALVGLFSALGFRQKRA